MGNNSIEDANDWYFSLFFDINRGGFIDVAEKILSFLDYASFVRFKQTCKTVYKFIKSSNIEQIKFRRKIRDDWKFGTHLEQTFNVSGLVSSAKLFDNSSKIVCGVDEMLSVSDTASRERLLSLRGHKAIITCVEVLQIDSRYYVVSGSQDGILAIWSLENEGECVCQKQLFGRIEVVKARNDLLVTAHFGIAFDVGCISVRRVVSPVELPVIFAIYEDLYPIFGMDFSDTHLAALEWSGTFNNVHAGNVLIFRWMETEPMANLSDLTFTCCKFMEDESFLITGGHDKLIRLWEVCSQKVECLRTLAGDKHSNVIVRLVLNGDRAASRDLDGNILIWDLMMSKDEREEDDDRLLLRRVKSASKTVTCIEMDERKLVMGSIGHFSVFDYWNTAKQVMQSPAL